MKMKMGMTTKMTMVMEMEIANGDGDGDRDGDGGLQFADPRWLGWRSTQGLLGTSKGPNQVAGHREISELAWLHRLPRAGNEEVRKCLLRVRAEGSDIALRTLRRKRTRKIST
eukprot:s2753_g5.t1